jgi:hypothetical protein
MNVFAFITSCGRKRAVPASARSCPAQIPSWHKTRLGHTTLAGARPLSVPIGVALNPTEVSHTLNTIEAGNACVCTFMLRAPVRWWCAAKVRYPLPHLFPGFAFRSSVFGSQVSGSGFLSHMASGFEFRILDFGFRGSNFGFRVSSFGFGDLAAPSPWVRVWGIKFWYSGSFRTWFRVLGFRVLGFEFRISRFGFHVSGFNTRSQASGYFYTWLQMLGFGDRVSLSGNHFSGSGHTPYPPRGAFRPPVRRSWPRIKF